MQITCNSDSNGVRAMVSTDKKDLHTKIFVNGDIVGSTDTPDEVFAKVKAAKMCGEINVYTGVCQDRKNRHIVINSEAGRCTRPLFVVKDARLVITDVPNAATLSWNELVTCGAVEFLDTKEASCSLIAVDLKGLSVRHTHMELHPSFMLGVLACSIPFSEHNQSPRNSYQSAMGKQAIGVYTIDYRHRFDTLGHVLNYPQKPIVFTRPSTMLGCDDLPCGINVIVAIATYTGFNQEDGIIVNKSAIQRGLFNSTFYRTYKEQNTKNFATGEKEYFCNAEQVCGFPHAQNNYSKLDDTGFVPVNTYVNDNDVIVSKVMPSKGANNCIEYKDTSVTVKDGEAGYVDVNVFNNNLFTTVNGDGHDFAKVRIRQNRIPCIGDKLASRFAQKGSIGMVLSEEDMPFTRQGVRPDIILNPMAIPSRMTIGQLMEVVMGKAGLFNCQECDAVPFSDVTMDALVANLRKEGFEGHADEVMYNGRTGHQMATNIFIGPTYYQRLKHMVGDKVHSRSTGAYSGLIRQPAEGRSRGGGLRLGEMERDVIACSGMMSFLKERFVENSDNFKVYVCKKCRHMAVVNPDMNIFKCVQCKNNVAFSEVRMPYSCKLFLQEIAALGVETKFATQ